MVGAEKPAPRYLQAEQWGSRRNDDPCVMTKPNHLSYLSLQTELEVFGDERYMRAHKARGCGAG